MLLNRIMKSKTIFFGIIKASHFYKFIIPVIGESCISCNLITSF